jgi:hypothetical protein
LNKSARRKCTPYEKIEMKPGVSIIKELNEENPREVYLCDDVMSTHASVPVDSVGPPSAEVCRAAASFP